MKKIITLLILLLSMGAYAQIMVEVSGHVINQQTGNPVPYHEITISLIAENDSLSGTTTAVYTDTLGYYGFNSVMNAQQGIMQISTSNCDGTASQSETVVLGANIPNIFVFDFAVNCQPASCQSLYNYTFTDLLSVQFQNQSFGEDLNFYWDFNDGTGSSEENPLKVYDFPGIYDVKLTVVKQDMSCSSDFISTVFVGDTLINNCFAMFYHTVNPNSNSVSFYDYSMGNPTVWEWNFGDGTTSAEQNPVHSYAENGVYEVNLKIENPATQCISSYMSYVYIGDTIVNPCQAFFGTFQGSNPFEIVFVDKSMGDIASWVWDFGDGTVSSEQNPVHVYSTAGVYFVTLTIQTTDNSCTSVYTQEVFVGNTPGCMAYFEALPTPEGATTYFFNNLSLGNIDTYYWDFGDGNSSTEMSPIHDFTDTGFYNVCLYVQSVDSSCFDMMCQTIVVGESMNCQAKFSYYPDSTNTQLSLQFIDFSFGQITSWMWTFGDGGSSTEANPVHLFAESGAYNVCLMVSGVSPNGELCQSTWCEDVYLGTTINDCFNYFTYTTAGNTVQFEGFHSTDIPASYQWDFGNGIVALGNPVTNVYPGPGVYYVKLTTWDDNNCTASSSQTIVIGDTIAFNQVYGQVFEGTFPSTEGMAMIFSIEQDTNYFPFMAISPVAEAGVYMFPFVPNGEFTILATPASNNGFLPTYYGNTLYWEEAIAVIPGTTQNPYDIDLIAASANANTGTGSISGFINQNSVRSGYIDKINVLLADQSHSPITFQPVASDGSFIFTGLGNGTYYIYPELSGMNSDFMQVDLTEGQNQFVVNMTMDGNSFLGTPENNSSLSIGTIYPNPVTDEVNFELNSVSGGIVRLMVYDLTSRAVAEHTYDLRAGSTSIRFSIASLPAGFYMVQVVGENGSQTSRKILKK